MTVAGLNGVAGIVKHVYSFWAKQEEPSWQKKHKLRNKSRQPKEPTTYTQAQLDSEADKRAAKALETAKAKWQAEQAKALEDAKSECARLAPRL